MSIDYDVEKTFSVREWLCPNDPHVGSHIRAHVTHYPNYKVDECIERCDKVKKIEINTEISAAVILADCSRSVQWDFCVWARTNEEFEKSVAQNLDKLNTFKRNFQEWEDAYRKVIDEEREKRNRIAEEIQAKLKEKTK